MFSYNFDINIKLGIHTTITFVEKILKMFTKIKNFQLPKLLEYASFARYLYSGLIYLNFIKIKLKSYHNIKNSTKMVI